MGITLLRTGKNKQIKFLSLCSFLVPPQVRRQNLTTATHFPPDKPLITENTLNFSQQNTYIQPLWGQLLSNPSLSLQQYKTFVCRGWQQQLLSVINFNGRTWPVEARKWLFGAIHYMGGDDKGGEMLAHLYRLR